MSLALTLVIGAWAVPRWGVTGAALATSAAYVMAIGIALRLFVRAWAGAARPGLRVGDHARITRTRRPRRSKLDELPQLFDVLAGQMSLVGPRPELQQYVALYPAPLRSKELTLRSGISTLCRWH